MSSSTVLRDLKKLVRAFDRQWYCKLCDRAFPDGPYCVENHFEKKHPKVKPSSPGSYEEEIEGLEWNWDSYDISIARVIKLINNYQRSLRRKPSKRVMPKRFTVKLDLVCCVDKCSRKGKYQRVRTTRYGEETRYYCSKKHADFDVSRKKR
jgi:hypothetical protein